MAACPRSWWRSHGHEAPLSIRVVPFSLLMLGILLDTKVGPKFLAFCPLPESVKANRVYTEGNWRSEGRWKIIPIPYVGLPCVSQVSKRFPRIFEEFFWSTVIMEKSNFSSSYEDELKMDFFLWLITFFFSFENRFLNAGKLLWFIGAGCYIHNLLRHLEIMSRLHLKY